MNELKNIGEKKHRKRTNKTIIIYVLSLGLGLIMGIGISSVEDGDINLPKYGIYLIALIFTLALYYLTWIWYKTMDEFEKKSFNEAGNFALHTGFIALPWFILNELGLAPKLDAIYLLLFMTSVFFVFYYGSKLLNR